MPAQCWMAPLIPQATYSSGDTRLPVCPTCSWCGRQPRLVTTRETPSEPSRRSVSSSRSLNPSALPAPRPAPTTTFADLRLPDSSRSPRSVRTPRAPAGAHPALRRLEAAGLVRLPRLGAPHPGAQVRLGHRHVEREHFGSRGLVGRTGLARVSRDGEHGNAVLEPHLLERRTP